MWIKLEYVILECNYNRIRKEHMSIQSFDA